MPVLGIGNHHIVLHCECWVHMISSDLGFRFSVFGDYDCQKDFVGM
jgi:hypothetical protein